MNKAAITDFNATRFFRGYAWNFKAYPDDNVAGHFSGKKVASIDLTDIKETQLYYDIRDILVCCMVNGEPYSYTSKIFSTLFLLPGFMVAAGYENFACIDNLEEATEKWCKYLTGAKRTYLPSYQFILASCYHALLEFRDGRSGLDRNIWRMEDIKINNERINKTSSKMQMNFWRIKNKDIREYMKVYFKYLLGGTELAYSTIYGRFCIICNFFNIFEEKSLADITHDDIEAYRVERNDDASRNNHIMYIIDEFYKYMIIKGMYDGQSPISTTDYMHEDRKHKYNTVPDEVIIETFRHLHKLRNDYLLIYLINVFTGIRISDICQLKTDCLYKNNTGFYLSHDVQKMQDVGSIPITKELYELIQKRIAYANKHEHEYLFTSDKDESRPYNARTYRENMKKNIQKWNIKMPDGTPYKFATHAFRHTIATTLFKMGMPSVLIQLGVLHHVEINMTRSYVDIDNESQLKLMEEKGIFIPEEQRFEKQSETDAALPNGYCHMPPQIHCPNTNACLNCRFFRTSIKFLDIHEQHLTKLEEQIMYYKSNGYKQNLAFAEADKEKLELIIARLKEIEGEEYYGTDTN